MNAVVDTLDREAKEFERDVGIPPCPAVLTRLLRETRADEPDFREIARLIANDVALAASMLKIANSPFYGLRTKAATVQQALTLLGLSSAAQLVTGLLLRQAFPTSAGPGMEHFWKSSMATGLIAAGVAREVGKLDPGLAHTYGLFRDCGMAVMMLKFPIYADILTGSALREGDRITEIEGERYAINHCLIGARLANGWQLGPTLVNAILNHHGKASLQAALPEAHRLICIGLVADKLYCDATGQKCPEWMESGEIAVEFFGLTSDRLTEMAVRVKSALHSLISA